MESEAKRPPFADHLTSVETMGGVPTRYSLQLTVDANDAGHALLADIDAALKRAQARESACAHEWVPQYGFGCTPGSTRDTTFCGKCGARRVEFAAPVKPEHPAVALLRRILPAMKRADDVACGASKLGCADEVAEVEAFLADRPAPAWTREAPKAGPGFYWVRYDRHELLVAEFVVEAESSYWLTSGDLEEDPVDKYEHWPVRLEPPK